ncbi:MAG: exodeoxyribonuclease VII large subunit [Alphaproteobacteria bacterium]|nr:exodeoxyribonuclease VII large subunit [Alphaproteobacteria bacterium]PHX99894.1 MAG: exodeoxyribonuclease VII large subunit [Rhodospirillaceae bacterium]
MSESPPEPVHNLPAFTVSELSASLKRTVEDAFGYVRVRGEVSQPKVATSGHCYLRLKDETAVLDGVIWRGSMAKLKIKLEEGMDVIATGRITTYPGKSSYQIVIDSVELAGVGALLKLLEDRRKMLAAEGLFNEDRKKPIPYLPGVIGVVTSPTGAVIRDIIHRVSDRFPRRIIVWPVRVQGEGAAEEVAAAIQGFNALKVGGAIPRPDVLIVARGGGSLEDLWAFNEEVVVRAAAASAIPLIAAVGHETDWTLIDYAADRRAPTPTAAAELAVPVRIDLVADLQQRAMRLLQSIGRTLSDLKIRLDGLVRGIPRLDAVVAEKEQALDGLVERLKLGPRALLQAKGQDLNVLSAGLNLTRLRRDIERHVLDLKQFHSRLSRASARAFSDASNELAALAARIESVSPQRVLERGYAMVLGPDGPITSVKNALAGSKVDVRFADGQVAAQIGAMGSDSATPHKRKTPAGGNQGSLF